MVMSSGLNMSYKIIFLVLFSIMCVHNNASAEILALTPYKFNVSGYLSLPMKFNRHDEFHLGLRLAPAFGVFLANNFEQRVQLSVLANYVYSKQERIIKTPVFWDVSTASIYYFSIDENIRLYLGGGMGVGFMDANLYSINILLDVLVGCMVALGINFALDVGMPLRIRISPRSFFDAVELPIGVVGFRYIF